MLVARVLKKQPTDPASAHARQPKGLGFYGEDLSRPVRRSPEGEGGRDSVKVPQPRKLSGLGNEAKTHVRPIRDDRNARLWSRTRLSNCQHPSIVPSGTELFKNAIPALRTGLLSSGPCGT